MVGGLAQTVGAMCLVAIGTGYAFIGTVNPWVFIIGASVLIPSPILINSSKLSKQLKVIN